MYMYVNKYTVLECTHEYILINCLIALDDFQGRVYKSICHPVRLLVRSRCMARKPWRNMHNIVNTSVAVTVKNENSIQLFIRTIVCNW